MPPVSHLSIVINFVQPQLCLRPDTETAYVIASKDCPLGVVLTTYGAKQGFCTRSAMVYFCLCISTLLVIPRLYSLCNTAIVLRQEQCDSHFFRHFDLKGAHSMHTVVFGKIFNNGRSIYTVIQWN